MTIDFEAQATSAEQYITDLGAGNVQLDQETCENVKAAAARLGKACIGVLERLNCCDCEEEPPEPDPTGGGAS